MVTYTFECPDELWREWADQIPRSKNLDVRLRELIESDVE